MQKAGGPAALELAIKEGRVIKAKVNNMPMFWFPRWEYSKESLFRQKMKGLQDKHTDDLASFDELAANKMGFEWEPANMIPPMIDMQNAPLPLQPPSSPMPASTTPSSVYGLSFGGGSGPPTSTCGLSFGGGGTGTTPSTCGFPFGGGGTGAGINLLLEKLLNLKSP